MRMVYECHEFGEKYMSRMNNQLRIAFATALAMPILASCESNSADNSVKRAETIENIVTDEQGRRVADPIAEFVVNTAPGQTGKVVTRNNLTVTIRVGSDYISATNARCRNMIVYYPSEQVQTNAVCFNGFAWETVLNQY